MIGDIKGFLLFFAFLCSLFFLYHANHHLLSKSSSTNVALLLNPILQTQKDIQESTSFQTSNYPQEKDHVTTGKNNNIRCCVTLSMLGKQCTLSGPPITGFNFCKIKCIYIYLTKYIDSFMSFHFFTNWRFQIRENLSRVCSLKTI